MPIRRVFLGLQRPALSASVDWLLERYERDGVVDLDTVTVVVPGSLAGRRLREILAAESEARRHILLPPRIATAGDVPERLYEPRRPFADELVQQLAWVHALRHVPPAVLAAVVPHPPEPDDLDAWLPLAQLVMRLHAELAADVLDFDDALRRAAAEPGFDERPRWEALRQVQRTYLDTLDAANLWDQQTARLFAIERGECQFDGHLVLLGTVDMNRALRNMLDAVGEQVTALVFAPTDWADRFDQHGCLLPEAWQQLPLPIGDQQIRLADDPVDQADAVAREVAAYHGRYRADEVLLGVPEPSIVPQIERQMAECGIAVRWGVGRELSASGPYRLLAAVAQWVERGRTSDFAALVRHPDVERWLLRHGAAEDFLLQLDEYQARHLPGRLADPWLGPAAGHDRIQAVYALIRQITAPLAMPRRDPAEWMEPVLKVLLNIYETDELSRDCPRDALTLGALKAMRDSALALGAIPEAIAPRVGAADAIRWLLAGLARGKVPPPADPQAIELLGWLELPWDDSPAVIVTSFNEGFIPEPEGADPFLPNRMRSALGLWDNARRYARDAYYLNVLSATRTELCLIVAHRDGENNPLQPSRLLFAADPSTAARRAERLFGRRPEAGARRPLSGSAVASRLRSEFVVPRPGPLTAVPEVLAVTAFRTYLACPYRFYLRHILRLAPQSDHAEELDAAAFGSLMHEVLDHFGREAIATSTDAEKISAFLHDTLTRRASQVYGPRPRPSVALQVAQLKARLAAFARWQARWAAQGYRIAQSEVSEATASATLDVDGVPLGLSGRIDRIDVNQHTGEHVILDYKSSSTVEPPEKTHRTRDGRWIDLQLPLYRHLARSLGLDGPLRFGYVAMPKDVTQIRELLADWDETALNSADEAARDVVRRIRRGEFWPMAEPSGGLMTEFAAICQEGVFDPQVETSGDTDSHDVVQNAAAHASAPATQVAPPVPNGGAPAPNSDTPAPNSDTPASGGGSPPSQARKRPRRREAAS